MDRLDKHFRDLTRQAFARYGFAYADLILQWGAIVGEELAEVSAPERIRWPRPAGDDADRRKSGGTLAVRVAEGRALEFQHLAPRIIERINGFYGYEAVRALKIVQGPIEGRKPRAAPQPPQDVADSAIRGRLAAIDDHRLKAALGRLGAGALARSETPPSPTSNPKGHR